MDSGGGERVQSVNLGISGRALTAAIPSLKWSLGRCAYNRRGVLRYGRCCFCRPKEKRQNCDNKHGRYEGSGFGVFFQEDLQDTEQPA